MRSWSNVASSRKPPSAASEISSGVTGRRGEHTVDHRQRGAATVIFTGPRPVCFWRVRR